MGITTIYVPKDKEIIWEKAKEVAQREGKSVSAIIIEFLEEYVKKHGEGNPAFTLDQFVEKEVIKAWPTLGHDPWRFDLSGFDDRELGEIRKQVYQWMKRIETEEALRRYEKR